MKKKLCDTCIYRNNVEQLKPCSIYRDDCEYYEKERGDMTREEAIHKMEYSKRAYQMLIDEKVQEGVLVGQGINAEWSADTPIIDAYKDMLEACDMAIKALEQEPKTAHWIGHREHCENLGVMPSGLGAYEWCSNCDCGIDVKEWHMNNYNYCPNCGCRMVELQESEDDK